MKKILMRFYPLFCAPKYVVSSQLFNKIGGQYLRIKLKIRAYKHKLSEDVPDAVKDIVNTLEEDGICVIENFLNDQEVNQLNKEITSLKQSSALKFETGKEGGEVEWEHGNFSRGSENSIINGKFRENAMLNMVVENYTKRKVLSYPEVIYQKLSMPAGVTDKADIQTVLHSDRYYRTIKIFYMLSDHTTSNGAFWFSPKSQVMDEEKIKYEIDYSSRVSLEMAGKHHLLDEKLTKFGRSTIHPDLVDKFPEKQITGKKNTLMVVDVSGFHKRGLIEENQSRETIRMIYHYIHAPVWSQKLFSLFKMQPGRYLN